MAYAAARPSFGEIWGMLDFDRFPVLAMLVFHGWELTDWGRTDTGLRVLGALIGIAILGVFWLGAWRRPAIPPTLAIALWGFNAIAIRYGDSIRPYGSGVLTLLLAAYSFGRLAERPSLKNFLIASLGSVLAVQCAYQNAFWVFAFGVSAAATLAARHWWSSSIWPLAAGAIAAISLVPYWRPLAASSDWSKILSVAVGWRQLINAIYQGVTDGNTLLVWLWFAILLACGIQLGFQYARRSRPLDDLLARSSYAAGSLVLGAMLFLIALWRLQASLQPWYFVFLLGAGAFCCNAILTVAPGWSPVRIALSLLIVAVGWQPAVTAVRERMTNFDQVAGYLTRSVAAGDLIVISPWNWCPTFARYYRGSADWTTMPDLSDRNLQRFDLVKAKMKSQDPVHPLIERVTSTLQRGDRVWLVGNVPVFAGDVDMAPLPPAPQSSYRWWVFPYELDWYLQTLKAIEQLSDARVVPLNDESPVARWEKAQIMLAD
jgi:hypothetical protein